MTLHRSASAFLLATGLGGCFAPEIVHDDPSESSGSAAASEESSAGMTSTVSDAGTAADSGPHDDSGDATGADDTTGADATTDVDETTDATATDESSGSSGEPVGCQPLSVDAATIALWHFDDAAGQVVADASGNGRDLQLGSTAVVDAADPSWGEGKFDGGLGFVTASQQYATRDGGGNEFPNNELTVEMWARTSSTGWAQIFTAGFINCEVAIRNDGAGISFDVGDGSNWASDNAEMPAGSLDDGAWHYIAVTYDGSMLRAYVDGVEIGSAAATSVLADPDDYKIGGRPANTFLEGDMDEVRVSDVARSADEIAAAFDGC